jgi:hypothetical protein
MGIRGLSGPLHRYGTLSSLSGDTVVIDGPSLIHQIFHGCLETPQYFGRFHFQPSYSTLGRIVVEWLEDLRRCDVTV